MITCNFDGACFPQNPGGIMGIGAIVMRKDEVLLKHSESIEANEKNTNNVAEYLSLIQILQFLLKNNLQAEKISVRGDSMLVVNQMKGKWRMKQGAYLAYAKEARELMSKFTNLSINWIPREENEVADELSKKQYS